MDLLGKVKSLLLGGKLDVDGRFELLRETTFGSMSQFHVARERSTGKIVGLKILDPEKMAAYEARFTGLVKPNEGDISLAINHQRIVQTFEHGMTTTGRRFVIMEFLDGPGLNHLILDRNSMLEGKRVHLIRHMAEALEAVHQAGYIHRDIAPRNYICAPDAGSLKLIDFGLTVPATKEFMQPGNRTGNPLYMAPEVVRRRATDKRVDIFALGVSAYQLCTFELPWPSQDTSGAAAMLHDTVKPIDILHYRPTLHPRLARAITRCLAIDPKKRPESAQQFLNEIRKVQSDDEA